MVARKVRNEVKLAFRVVIMLMVRVVTIHLYQWSSNSSNRVVVGLIDNQKLLSITCNLIIKKYKLTS